MVLLQTKIKSCVSCFLTVSWDLCLRACRSKRTRQCPCMFLVAYEATLRALKGRLVNAKSPSWVRAEEVIGKNRTEKYHPRPRVIDLHFNQIIDFFVGVVVVGDVRSHLSQTTLTTQTSHFEQFKQFKQFKRSFTCLLQKCNRIT